MRDGFHRVVPWQSPQLRKFDESELASGDAGQVVERPEWGRQALRAWELDGRRLRVGHVDHPDVVAVAL